MVGYINYVGSILPTAQTDVHPYRSGQAAAAAVAAAAAALHKVEILWCRNRKIAAHPTFTTHTTRNSNTTQRMQKFHKKKRK